MLPWRHASRSVSSNRPARQGKLSPRWTQRQVGNAGVGTERERERGSCGNDNFVSSFNPSANQLFNQSVNVSIDQSIKQCIHPSINQCTDQSLNQLMYRPITQSFNQSLLRQIHVSTKYLVRQINVFSNQSMHQPIGQSTHQQSIRRPTS